LGAILRVLTEIAIWFGIVILPLIVLPAMVIWGFVRLIKRIKA